MTIQKIFGIEYDDTDFRVKSREGNRRDFKESFQTKKLGDYFRTMAAFANNQGGEIVFGIKDRPHEIVGTDLASLMSPEDLANKIQEYFDPSIFFEVETATVEERDLFRIAVSRADSRPVICRKTLTVKREKKNREYDETVLEESAIYYRYGARSKQVRYAELSAMLQERREQELQSILQNLQIMQEIGPQRAGIVDMTKRDAPGRETALYLSKEAAKHLNVIERGRFVEDKGAPAYTIAGRVELKEGIEVPIPDSDRVLPSEAATKVAPTLRKAYPNLFPSSKRVAPYHVKEIAKALKIRGDQYKNNENNDTKYAYFDEKSNRFFYRPAFIYRIEKTVEESPQVIRKIFE